MERTIDNSKALYQPPHTPGPISLPYLPSNVPGPRGKDHRPTGAFVDDSGKRYERDVNAPPPPDFDTLKEWRESPTASPIEKLLADSTRERPSGLKMEAGYSEYGGGFRPDSPVFLREPNCMERPNVTQLAWYNGGSAISELMKLKPEKQEALLSTDGAKEMLLKEPQAVLESVKKMERQTGERMFEKESLASKLGDKLGDVKSIAQGMAGALRGEGTHAMNRSQEASRGRGM